MACVVTTREVTGRGVLLAKRGEEPSGREPVSFRAGSHS